LVVSDVDKKYKSIFWISECN